jgi:hypothetical protein
VSMVVFGFFADEFLDQVAAVGVSFLGAHDCGFEAETQTDCDAVCECGGERLRILLKVELCEEAERAEREGDGGGDDALEEP